MLEKFKAIIRNWLLKEELDKWNELEKKYREMVDLSHKTYRLSEDARQISAESITRCNAATNELEECKQLMKELERMIISII